MFRPRIIPVLLLHKNGLIKSVKFKDFRYIGDPLNAVKIFNDLKADEIIFLDIAASKEKRSISLDFVKYVGEEANMPFAVGGGISDIRQVKGITAAGAEKVVLNTIASLQPEFVQKASDTFGSSTIAVCIDVKKTLLGKEQVMCFGGTQPIEIPPIEFAQLMEEKGAGEIIIQSIDRDGTMVGYDIPLIKKISEAVSIPVVALGGAGNIQHLSEGFKQGYATGLAAGSIFVYHGSRKGILINYPSEMERNAIFSL